MTCNTSLLAILSRLTRATLLGAVALCAPQHTTQSPVLAQEPSSEVEDSAVSISAEQSQPAGSSEEAFAPLGLPDPDQYRSATGAPGERYWQQRADYRIQARLEDNRISGTVTITYTNASPDVLTSLWLQLDQNLFRRDSYGAQRTDKDDRHGGFFKNGGFDISAVMVTQDTDTLAAEHRIEDTMMEVLLPEPLPANDGQLELSLDFEFEIPESGADRMGRLRTNKGTIYQLAQWYPRMFTYDDVNGWNDLPYLGQGEWYLEYGDFDVELTVPREMIVVATGELQNPEAVLTSEQQRRLVEARESAEAVLIVAPGEVGKNESRPAGEGPITWKFRAENVRDVAWAGSKAFVWDAAGWEDVLIMSAYPVESMGRPADRRGPGRSSRPGITGWERSTEYLRHSVKYYSEQWYRYPYPVAINVAGRAFGMEYPMIVFCSHQARGGFLFAVTDHEIGHTWFPMLVGSDERRYAWMDEGFDNFMNYYSSIAFGGEPILSGQMEPGQVASAMRGEYAEHPIVTPPDSLSETELGFLAYNKPAAVLRLLREVVLGPELFDEAFRTYIDRWAYKHPQPADFFRTMEDVSGRDLDWFFRGWLYGNGVLDQAIASVSSDCTARTTMSDAPTEDTPECETRVTVENRGDVVMPLELRFIYRDGSEDKLSLPVDIWRDTSSFVATVEGARIRNVQIDPVQRLPDANRANNTWGRGLISRQQGGS